MNEIKADRIQIGFYEKQVNFSLKTINIKKGDIIYLFTDGYFDQFGVRIQKKLCQKDSVNCFSKIITYLLDHKKKSL